MRKSLIVVASALLLAVGASVPGGPKLSYDLSVFSRSGPAKDVVLSGGTKRDDYLRAEVQPQADPTRVYRPCRPGPGDDRCIQLYERGVRTAIRRPSVRAVTRSAARRSAAPAARPAARASAAPASRPAARAPTRRPPVAPRPRDGANTPGI
ncbi:hypothetical protein [Allosphingosinicella sp.]|jgi:hypothetical protein|uniref:hypothetical protein n=1 Tax=Allosphingosinicella sp. TaxID=2823234 RepID=UPI002EFC3298